MTNVGLVLFYYICLVDNCHGRMVAMKETEMSNSVEKGSIFSFKSRAKVFFIETEIQITLNFHLV